MKNKIMNFIVLALPLLITAILNVNSTNLSSDYIEQKKTIMENLAISELYFSLFTFLISLFIILVSYIILKNILIVMYKFNNVEEEYLKSVAKINAVLLIFAPTVLSYILRDTIDQKNEYSLYLAQLINLLLFWKLYPKKEILQYKKLNYYTSIYIYILLFIIPPIIIQKIA